MHLFKHLFCEFHTVNKMKNEKYHTIILGNDKKNAEMKVFL